MLRLRLAAVIAVVLVAVPDLASAAFSAAGTGDTKVGAATVRNGTGLTATCGSGSVKGISLAWSPSPDSFVTGYTVRRSINGAAAVVLATASGLTYNDASAQSAAKGDTYSYTISAVVQSWSTSPSPVASRSFPFPKGQCT